MTKIGVWIIAIVVMLYFGSVNISRPRAAKHVPVPTVQSIFWVKPPPPFERVPLVVRNSTEEILRVDGAGYITVRGKPATDRQIVEALREWAMQNTARLY